MMKKIIKLAAIIGIIVAILTAVDFFNTAGNVKNPDEQLARMLPGERAFCEQTLWQIDSSSTERDVLALLGPPSRSLKLKKNWHVVLDGKKDRVGVYFTTKGLACEVVLDGGPGRFYYRRSVKDHEQTTTGSSQPAGGAYVSPAAGDPSAHP